MTSYIKDKNAQNLIDAYHLFADLHMDDLTYTHLSARHSEKNNMYFINALDVLFKEVDKTNLLCVDLEGVIHGKNKMGYNITGHQIHSAIYKARPEINAVMHLHTVAGVAVSALKEGLLPLSQFAMHFHHNIAYHTYEGLVLNKQAMEKLLENFTTQSALILRNHGLLTVGKTIEEAFFYMYYLEKACQVQCKAMAMSQNLIFPSTDICQQAHHQMKNFESHLGQRDFLALQRQLKQKK